MKTTVVRVTREYKLAVTETTDVTVTQDDDASSYPRPANLAEALIKAQIATGQPTQWSRTSEAISSHSEFFDTEVVSGDAPEVLATAPSLAAPVALDDEVIF